MGHFSLSAILARVKKKSSSGPTVPMSYDVDLVKRAHGKSAPRLRQIAHINRILASWEKTLMRLSLVGFFFGIVWLGFVVVSNWRIQVPAVGGRYVEAMVGSPQLINPIFASLNEVDSDISSLVYSGLMRYDESGNLVPDLAVTTTISDDKKVYTFELRDGVVWHDGEPFTAEDVAYTFETIQNPVVGSSLYLSFQGVTVEAIDQTHVKFTLKETYAPFLSTLTVGIIPKHIWSQVSDELLRLHKRNLQPVGTGPYEFKKLEKDGEDYRYILSRFDKFYRRAPYIQEFVFQFYREYSGETGAVQALHEKKVDGINFIPHDYKDKIGRKHISVYTLQIPQYTALFFQGEHEPFLKDVSVRSALEAALDKDRILKEALKGEGTIIHGPILPGFPGYSETVSTTPYDGGEANKTLDKVSTRVSSDDYRALRHTALVKELSATASTSTVETAATTVDSTQPVSTSTLETEVEAILDREINRAQTFYRKDKGGNIVSLTLVTADTPEYHRVADLVVGFWQEVGIKTDVKFVNPREMVRDVLKTRDYDILLYGTIIGSDPDQYPLWHSSQVNYPGLNLSKYVNRSVDEILQKSRESASESEMSELYAKFQNLLIADHPAAFLYSPTYRYVQSDKIKGVNLSRIFEPKDRFDGVTEWYIKTRGVWK